MDQSKRLDKREKKLWNCMDRRIDGILITSPENVRYLCGFTGSEGSLLLTRGEGFFFTDGRYTTQARQQVVNVPVVTFKDKYKAIGRTIKKLHIKTLAFEARTVTVAALNDLLKAAPPLETMPCTDNLDMLRALKDTEEIKLLKKAAGIAHTGLQETLTLMRPGMLETEVATELEYRMRRHGAEDLAFQTIVASGHRSALPHGIASQKKIRAGEFVTIDYGCIYQGYCSDETCTVIMGEPAKRQKNVYMAVKQAHDRALQAVRPGKALKAIDAVARRHLEKAGLGKQFTHGTGHCLGLCVHEMPVVSPRSQARAEKGMVFTIEPGAYFPKWGGVRIEDTVVVTAEGCRLITQSPKKLLVVE